MAKPKIANNMRGTLIRSGGVRPGAVSDGYSVQPIARVSPHNANKRYLIANRRRKAVQV